MAFRTLHQYKRGGGGPGPARNAGRGNPFKHPRAPPATLPTPKPSQQLIENITLSSISEDETKPDKPKIKHVEFIASYNWKDEMNPKILIPGKPPRWQPPSTPQQLHEDGGLYYRDPNSARYPSYPTEPAIHAIQQCCPTFPLHETQIFGCGNTIGSLLSFVRDEDRTFRFGVELLGSTLFLVRKTDEPGEVLKDVRGYGHTFPEAYTSWDKDVRGSASHQRIISYDFGGLKMIVRSESDGYLPEYLNHDKSESGIKEDDNDIGDIRTEDVVADGSMGAVLSLLKVQSRARTTDVLEITQDGDMVPQLAVFDLKTRGIKRKADNTVDDFLHRLWVNQTPNMVLAYHRWGTFEPGEIRVIDVRERVESWEDSNWRMLAKLVDLLEKLIQTGKSTRQFEVRRLCKGPLEIWSELDGWSVLPAGLKASWTGVEERDLEEASDKDVSTKISDDDDSDDDYLKF